jgi:hypothetical protein
MFDPTIYKSGILMTQDLVLKLKERKCLNAQVLEYAHLVKRGQGRRSDDQRLTQTRYSFAYISVALLLSSKLESFLETSTP